MIVIGSIYIIVKLITAALGRRCLQNFLQMPLGLFDLFRLVELGSLSVPRPGSSRQHA